MASALDRYLLLDSPDRKAETICKQARQIMYAVKKTLDSVDRQVTAYGEDALEREIGQEAYRELHDVFAGLSAVWNAYDKKNSVAPLGEASSQRPLEEVKAELVSKLLSHAEEKINATVTAQFMGKEIAVHERARDFWGNQAAVLALGVPFRPFTIRAIDGSAIPIDTQETFLAACGTVQAAAMMESELANAVCDRVMAAKGEFRARAEATHYLET